MLHWLFLHFGHLISVFLAATAPVVLPSPEAAGPIIDGGEGGGGQETTEETGDTTGIEDQGTTEETTEPVEGDQSQEGKVDWRTVPPEVKAHVQEIAKTNPKLSNMLQNAIYTSSTFLREVPGGLKEIKALKSTIEELGGIDEIRNVSSVYKNLVDEQEDMDNKARAGDPEILANYEQIAGKEGFSKLVESALPRWAALDPDGYSYQISKIMVNAMREGGLVADMQLAFKMLKLGSPEALREAQECMTRVANWANGINRLAITPPKKPQVDPKIAQEQQNLETQRTQLFNDRFATDFGSWRNRQINEQVASVANGRKLNDYQMNTLGTRIINDIKDILTSDPEYMKSLKRLHDARDMAELSKFTRARTLKLLPEVTKKAYRSLFSNPSPIKKPSAKPDVNGNPNSQKPQVVVKGWTHIDAKHAPKPTDIDSKNTTFEMKFHKQAILKNGTKVYWGTKAPA